MTVSTQRTSPRLRDLRDGSISMDRVRGSESISQRVSLSLHAVGSVHCGHFHPFLPALPFWHSLSLSSQALIPFPVHPKPFRASNLRAMGQLVAIIATIWIAGRQATSYSPFVRSVLSWCRSMRCTVNRHRSFCTLCLSLFIVIALLVDPHFDTKLSPDHLFFFVDGFVLCAV